ncbi:unnamed protein product [Soboliphyme baturini]|uniref:Major surface glycoprotein n=1 Tax=Soboliphyme baturini TaxID=241478 RepID=A0A183ITC8_9BILA|nr:unnamed protein product [Soboliphyme baturini]
MYQLRLVLFTLIIAACYAEQDCKAEMKTFHGCFKETMKKVLLDKAGWTELKDKVIKCFTDNGCDAPSKDFALGHLFEGAKAKLESLKKCLVKSGTTFKGKVEECVKKDIPEFHIDSEDMKKFRHGLFSTEHLHSVIKVLIVAIAPEHCAKENRGKVEACLGESFKNKGPLQEKVDEVCKGHKECHEKLSSGCKEELKHLSDSLSKCSCKGGVDTAAIQNELKTCLQGSFTEEESKDFMKLLNDFYKYMCEKAEVVAKGDPFTKPDEALILTCGLQGVSTEICWQKTSRMPAVAGSLRLPSSSGRVTPIGQTPSHLPAADSQLFARRTPLQPLPRGPKLAGNTAAKILCLNEIDKYFKCFQESAMAISWNDTYDQQLQQAIDCFRENGCREPALDLDKDVWQVTNGDGNFTDIVKDCLAAGLKDITAMAEDCVQKDIPTFRFYTSELHRKIERATDELTL